MSTSSAGTRLVGVKASHLYSARCYCRKCAKIRRDTAKARAKAKR